MTMRTTKLIAFIAIIILVVGHSTAVAQFEQKVTLNFSVGSIMPIGVKEYTYKSINGDYINTWLMPYLFSNYKMGYSFTGGALFNINRYFSLGTGIGVERIGNWEYTDSYTMNGVRYEKEFLAWEITQEGSVLDEGINELKMYNLSIGVFPRVNLAYGKRLNPYVFVEVTFNYTDINYVDNRRDSWIDLGGSEQSYDEWFESLSSPSAYNKTPQSSFGVGLYPGVGFDFNLNSNMGLFIQGGYSFISINKSDLEEANLEPESFNTIKVEVGIKFSFLRSKDI
jgi:hypothetical protein